MRVLSKPQYGHGSGMILRTALDHLPRVKGVPLAERIERFSMPVTECGCWIWMASGNRDGFGTTRVNGQKTTAHRASWMAFRGPIPSGLHVRHSCDIPLCVNPDHLSLGTRADNMRDKKLRGRHRAGWMWGTTLTPSPARRVISVRERFERHIAPEPNSGCWLWSGAGDRYGQFLINGKPRPAHRVSWQIYRGVIPKAKMVLHRCDVGFCVNPEHLFLGDQSDNMRDRSAKGRHNARRGAGVNTAKLTLENVLAIRGSGESRAVLAQTYGVTKDTIWEIQTRKTWRHV